MGKKNKKKSSTAEPDMGDVMQAIEHYSDGDIENRQEILEELHEGSSNNHKRLNKKIYEKELARLQSELVKMQYWVKATGFRMIVLF